MDGYVLGIDGGGTKTAVCAADLQGNILSVFKTGAINLNGESADNVKKNLHGIFREASLKIGDLQYIRSVCIGAAGISNADARLFLENTVRDAGYTGRLIIAGDHQTALFGALGNPVGIILIAGTGSICYGRNASGKEHRAGGYGYLIDDEGSGYAIGRDILKAMVRSHDGREEKTVLTQMVLEQLKVSTIEEVIGFLYHKNTNKRDIAALAPILARALEEGDEAARKIASKCCGELVKLVSPVAEKLGLEDCYLAMAGSILQKDAFIRKGFIDAIQRKFPGMVCTDPKNDASYGAVLMALRNE